MERATGIEPAFSAWEADVLPLNYAREAPHCSAGRVGDSEAKCPRGLGCALSELVTNSARTSKSRPSHLQPCSLGRARRNAHAAR